MASPTDFREAEEPEEDVLERLDDRFESLKVGSDRVDRDIVSELSTTSRPLAHPERFPTAHQAFARGLEVMVRNGRRPPTFAVRLGPLRPVATVIVQLITRWIVDSQAAYLIERVHQLYQIREANAPWGSTEHHMLRRSRLQMATIAGNLEGNQLGLPSFLLGGAFISTGFGILQTGVKEAVGSPLLLGFLIVVALLIVVGVPWAVLMAAAVARRRIKLSIGSSLIELYEAMGSTGDAPRDKSYQFAIYGLVFFVVAAIVVPAGIVFIANQ